MATYESTTTRLIQQELGACALIQDLLPLYLEGEVSPGSRDLIIEHLARCERCAGFLAGAQSVHAQLRHDRKQHIETMKRDQPVRQTITGVQRIAQSVAAGIIGIIGLIACGGLWSTISAPARLASLMLGLMALGLVLVLAAIRRIPLTFSRMLVLSASCFAACIGVISTIGQAEYDRGGAATFFGLLLVMVSLATVWSTLRRAPAAQDLGRTSPELPIHARSHVDVSEGL